ncbi:ATP-dependent DNA helicase PIF1 [Pycnococcus provasolii]
MIARRSKTQPIEHLNMLTTSSMPPHDLQVKLGVPLILLRNLSAEQGLMNGTKLKLLDVMPANGTPRVLRVRIMNRPRVGEEAVIPRILLTPNVGVFPFDWRRRQFPVKLAFAMTINKSQAQTLTRVALLLSTAVFTHGQLYVGLSRVGSPRHIRSNVQYAKVAAANKQRAIEYELETAGDSIDLSEAALEAAGLRCIKVIEERIEECKVEHPEGFMLSIYGTSTGSLTVELEGKCQFSGRGYSTPPIVDKNGNVIAMGVQGAHGPGGESVFDCGSSKVLSKEVETAAQLHFTPLCDASQGMMPRL